ncbi:MAG: hypothetical protein RL653_4230 [Pseudomonadota bacterium]|jgi:hypothetical protein
MTLGPVSSTGSNPSVTPTPTSTSSSSPTAATPAPASSPAPKPLDTFATGSSSSASTAAPPPLATRTVKAWQDWCDQNFRQAAQAELARKRGSSVPDPQVKALLQGPASKVFVGAWSTTPGADQVPVFFQEFPPSPNTRMQLYTFPRNGQWVSFEVAKDFYKAYADPTFTGGKLGTSSALGFPDSGSEFLRKNGPSQPFAADPEVAALLAAGKSVNFQKFTNGYLVVLNGKVQAFKLDGTRMGSPFPGGRLDGAPVVYTPGTKPAPSFAPLYQSYEVVPGVSVPGRIGMHWGAGTHYDNVARINEVADLLKARGVGYVPLIVDARNPQHMKPVIDALLARGIEPVARILPGGEYNKTWDMVTAADIAQVGNAAAVLKGYGVKMVKLDNEPNWLEAGKQLYHAYRSGDATARAGVTWQYGRNLALTLVEIQKRAPGMATGIASFGTGYPGGPGGPGSDYDGKQAFTALSDQMFKDMMYALKANLDLTQGGAAALDKVFIGVHPYVAPGDTSFGAAAEDRYRTFAATILQRPNIRSLALEGGIKPSASSSEAGNNTDNLAAMRDTAKLNNGTQCLWILGDHYLTGAPGGPSAQNAWELDAFVTFAQDAQGRWVPVRRPFFDSLLKMANGTLS